VNIKNSIIEPASFSASEGKSIASELVKSSAQLKSFVIDFLGSDIRFRQRASWVLVELAQNHQEILIPHINILVAALFEKSEDSIKRNILRIFQFMQLPKQYHEQLINYCFDIIMAKEEAIAVQVFAMSVLFNIIEDYPDLQRELVLLLEENLPYASAGYKSRAKKIIHAYHKKR
jgi:hypothetical protein